MVTRYLDDGRMQLLCADGTVAEQKTYKYVLVQAACHVQ